MQPLVDFLEVQSGRKNDMKSNFGKQKLCVSRLQLQNNSTVGHINRRQIATE